MVSDDLEYYTPEATLGYSDSMSAVYTAQLTV